MNASRYRNRKGFVLIAMAIGLIVLMGSLGIAVDLGRAFVAKNEAQAFTDAAALAAAAELDSTLKGITDAKAAVAASANKWNFATKSFTGYVTQFSTNKTTWVTDPATGAGYKYVRVTASSNSLPTYFASTFGAPKTMNVAARSMAGIELPTTFPQGVFPFAPIAHSSTPPNFGYTKGDELTLLWPSSVNSLDGKPTKMNDLCMADRSTTYLSMVQAGTIAERGYIQDTSASALAAAIEDDYMTYTVALGQPAYQSGGVKTTVVYQSLNDRSDQDSLPNVPTYDAYIAAHDSSPMRRVVIVPIVNDYVNEIIVGFVKVFLPPNQPHSPNKAKCAEYIGPADTPTGNGAEGANLLRLLE